MVLKNKPVLLYDASVIRNERADYHNTAERVGLMFVDLINAIDMSLDGVADLIKTEVNDAMGDINLPSLDLDLSNYVTKDLLRSELGNYVTIGTEQEVTGQKRFTKALRIGTADDYVELSYSGGALHVNRHILGEGEITAYGNGGGSGSGSGSGAGGGASYLRELLDVSIPGTPSAGQVLMWNTSALNGAGAWVASSISAGLDEAALGTYLSKHGYATEKYVTNAIDQIDLSGYVLRLELPDFDKFALADDLKNYVTNIALADTLAGYVTIGTEQTIKARKRFEREIVLGTADDHVTLSYADGALHVDGHVLARGEITAYGYAGDGSIGTGLLLGDLADVETAGAEDGMALVYSGGKWKPGAVAAGGVSGDYVTIDTQQVIRGRKTFKSIIEVNGDNSSFPARPCLMLHMPNIAYSKMVIDNGGHWHLVEGGQTDYANYRMIKAAGFVTPGGTASQFLKADGSVDGTGYFYHRRDESGVNIDTITAVAGGLYELYNPGGTLPIGNNAWYKVMDWGANDALYRVQLATTLSTNNALYLRHKHNGNWQPWRMLLDTVNYAGTLDGRYVKKAGDMMTGTLTFTKTPTNQLINGTYNTAGATSNVIWCDPATNRVIYGSPNWSKVVLETAAAATCVFRQTSGTEYKIWDSGNDGNGSGLDADLLDGRHASDFAYYGNIYAGSAGTWQDYLKEVGWNPGIYSANGWSWARQRLFTMGSFGTISTESYGAIVYRKGLAGSTWQLTAAMWLPAYQTEKFIYLTRLQTDGTSGTYTSQTVLRFADYDTIINGNVASATKLQTARKLWGNAFDGTADVSGTLSGVSGINFSHANAADMDEYGNIHFRASVGSTWSVYADPASTNPILTATRTTKCVGIGTTTPTEKLHIIGNAAASGSIALTQNDGKSGYGISLYGGPVHVKNYGMLFALTSYMVKHGSVQGDWATYLTMDGADNRGWIFYNAAKKAGVFSISAAGNVLANGEVTAYSDARLKQSIRDVVPLHGCRLRPVSYYKDGARHVGLIAQDVQPLCPEAVHTAGEYLALSYNAALVYGFAGVYSEIDALRERVRELETEVKLLKAA